MVKIMKVVQLLFICLLMLTCFNCCKDKCHDQSNPDCENYDPCYGREAANASFTINESAWWLPKGWTYYDTDTILTLGANFTAVQEASKYYNDSFTYEWHIGSEIITDKSFYREDFPPMQKIPVTLTVRHRPSKSCFPDDSGVETVTRYFVYDSTWRHSRVNGIYKGYFNDNPADTSTVTIYYGAPGRMGASDIEYPIRIRNLFKNGCDIEEYDTDYFKIAYRQMQFFFPGISCTRNAHGYVKFEGKDYSRVLINWNEEDIIGNILAEKSFTGYRQ